jgi:hypothetical protein
LPHGAVEEVPDRLIARRGIAQDDDEGFPQMMIHPACHLLSTCAASGHQFSMCVAGT